MYEQTFSYSYIEILQLYKVFTLNVQLKYGNYTRAPILKDFKSF